MSKKGFILNKKGVSELMKSSEMINILDDYGNSAFSKLGNGYGKKTHVGKTRANVSLYAHTTRAKRDNMKNNTLLKAL